VVLLALPTHLSRAIHARRRMADIHSILCRPSNVCFSTSSILHTDGVSADVGSSGDVCALRRVSFDKALQSGSAVASTGKKMSWKLADWNERPKVMWARVAPLDSEGKLHAGQICVRFDTQQVDLTSVRLNELS